jgi:hypothetical protein
MNNESNPRPNGKKEINLQQIAQQFMGGMQRHFDMLSFNLASRESAQEEVYKRISQTPKVMPAVQVHQNFEQMQAYARDLMVRQLVNDSLNLVVSVLNNTHFFLSIVKSSAGQQEVSQDNQKAAQELHQNFVKAQLHERFDLLESDFGISCELEDTIISLGFCLQVFMQNRGVVQAAHLDDEGELVVELKKLELQNPESDTAKAHGKIVDHRKIFHEGDTVFFEDHELQLILVTIAAFGDRLFASAAKFIQATQEKR